MILRVIYKLFISVLPTSQVVLLCNCLESAVCYCAFMSVLYRINPGSLSCEWLVFIENYLHVIYVTLQITTLEVSPMKGCIEKCTFILIIVSLYTLQNKPIHVISLMNDLCYCKLSSCVSSLVLYDTKCYSNAP